MTRLLCSGSALLPIVALAALAGCAKHADRDANVDNLHFNIPPAQARPASVKEDVTYPDMEAAGGLRDPFVWSGEFVEPPPPNPNPPISNGPGTRGARPGVGIALPPANPPSKFIAVISGKHPLFFFNKLAYSVGDTFMKNWRVSAITSERATLTCIAEGYTGLTTVMNFARDVVSPILP